MPPPSPIPQNYTQPDFPASLGGGWRFNVLDYQVVTKAESWTQDAAKRKAEYVAGIALGITHVALAVPYDNATKYGNYATEAHGLGKKVWHRSHWNAWEGDNGSAANLTLQKYLDDTYDFIIANPTFFEDGDIFSVCVECNNANGTPNLAYPFRTGNVVGGAFNMTIYNQFLRDQVTVANAAFAVIGKKVITNRLSFSLSLLNLAGQTLDSGTTGNSNGLTDANFVQDFNSILTIDHYLSNTYRYDDAAKYWTKYSSDLDKIHAAFPNCKLMIGEWGYHTTTSVAAGEKHGMFEQIVDILRSKSYIDSVSFWVHMGSSTASIFIDSSGTITPSASFVSNAIKRAFTTGNASFGSRKRI